MQHAKFKIKATKIEEAFLNKFFGWAAPPWVLFVEIIIFLFNYLRVNEQRN